MSSFLRYLISLSAVASVVLLLSQTGCLSASPPSGQISNTNGSTKTSATYSYPLDHWIDTEQARKNGELVLYMAAAGRQAETLNGLSVRELCGRIRPAIDALEEEIRWSDFIGFLLSSNSTHHLSWSVISDLNLHFNTMIVSNLLSLKMSLQETLRPESPAFARKELQRSIVCFEKEFPIIQKDRRAIVEVITTQILGHKLVETRTLDDFKILKTMVIRGSQ